MSPSQCLPFQTSELHSTPTLSYPPSASSATSAPLRTLTPLFPYHKNINLTNLPIAITGASSGIGAATAIACANAGMPVALAARRIDKLESLAKKINNTGGRAIAIQCNVTKDQDCINLIQQTESQLGPIHAVFANAGYGQSATIADTSDQDIRDMFDTNFWGSMRVIRPALERMQDHGKGHILFCSSCLSKIGLPNSGPYCATKAAQDHIGRAMRHELRSQNIAVSTIHPIGTKTEFFDIAKARGGKQPTPVSAKHPFVQPPERVARAIVKQLKKNKGAEVWTSHTIRILFGLSIISPTLADWLIARRYKPNS